MAPAADNPGHRTVPVRKGPSGAAAPPNGVAEGPRELLDELAISWQAGQPVSIEELLERHPELRDNAEASVRLIYEEVCLREERGEKVSAEEVVRRFPRWRAELEVLLDCHDLLNVPPAAPDFPLAGEKLGGLELLLELGRGTQGHVFLATQPSLAGRPVVLKLTSRDNHEHFSLARLQHTNIVPLYWADDFPERNLRMLCMPYLGGATLARLLAGLSAVPAPERTGQHILEALDRAHVGVPVPLPASGPVRDLLGRASYIQAVCWLGACLADALHYAGERGLIHLDLKPSNVLLAADGTPMLLDFHLAREPLKAGQEAPEWFGGTPAYMSPEQRAAVTALGAGRPVPAAIDGRSDVYSLGLLLYESLGGGPPSPAGEWPRLDHFNPRVSPGLADIVRKCLEKEPVRRYLDSASLAADLRRHLGDLPLRGVANRSLMERWRKWRRRRPQAVPLTLLLVGVLACAMAAWVHLRGQQRERLDAAAAALSEGRHQLKEGQVARALETLERGRTLAAETVGGTEVADALEVQLRRGRRLQAARQLHEVVQRLAFLGGADALSARHRRELEARCRALWAQRGRLLQDKGEGLSAQQEERLRTDLLDLATVWAALRVSLATAGPAVKAARREALRVLDEAEKLFGASPVLEQERCTYAGELGLKETARKASDRLARLKPRTKWEGYAVGRALLRAGKVKEAAATLERVLEENPQSFWPNFYLGVCQFRLKRYAEAHHSFGICVALAPARAECYYNRGLAQAALGRSALALRDYDRALRLDPALAAAAQNRGLLHYRAGHHARAEADLERALSKGVETAPVYYALALAQYAQGKRDAALHSVDQALQLRPAHAEARALRAKLLAGK